MLTRILVGAALSCLCCTTTQAALHHFTLQGETTIAQFGNVNVGDPFTIRYVADSMDTDPSPAIGRYVATPATVTFPNATINSAVESRVEVGLNSPVGSDRVTYFQGSFNYFFRIHLTFPPQTLNSDQLPLALPLSSATSATLEYYDFGVGVVGTITSYMSTEVPEPVALGPMPMIMSLLACARWLRLPNRPRQVGSRCRVT